MYVPTSAMYGLWSCCAPPTGRDTPRLCVSVPRKSSDARCYPPTLILRSSTPSRTKLNLRNALLPFLHDDLRSSLVPVLLYLKLGGRFEWLRFPFPHPVT